MPGIPGKKKLENLIQTRMPGIPGKKKCDKKAQNENQEPLELTLFQKTKQDSNNKPKPEISGNHAFVVGNILTVFSYESKAVVYKQKPGIPGILKPGNTRQQILEGDQIFLLMKNIVRTLSKAQKWIFLLKKS